VAIAGRTDFLDMHGDALMALAEVLRQAGRDEEARSAAQEAIQLYERRGNVVSVARAGALLGELAT
jgi:hypothetical protein